MESKYAIKNGELIEKESASVSVYNKAMFFDFCVYGNIKIVKGKMFMPDSNAENLFHSAEVIGIEHKFRKNEVVSWARKIIAKNNLKDALIRMLLIGQEKDEEPILFLFPVGLTFYPAKFYNYGVKVITFKGERFIPSSKSKNLLLGYIAYREAAKQDAIDALLVDNDGNIREGTRSSFFAIKDSHLIMPPAGKALGGLTREIIKKISPKMLKIREEDISLAKIEEYDGYFLTGSTMKIMPVRQIDDKILSPKAAEKIRKLQGLYEKYTSDKYVE